MRAIASALISELLLLALLLMVAIFPQLFLVRIVTFPSAGCICLIVVPISVVVAVVGRVLCRISVVRVLAMRRSVIVTPV